MDFEEARKKHAEWRLKFRGAISGKEVLNADLIAKDDQCMLGKWLHGEAKIKFGRSAAYAQCVEKHAQFHLEASKVAKVINARQYTEATAMLGIGTGFSRASAAIGNALDTLEKNVSQKA
jgi:methyl-accepting chemotaxis protein